MKHIASAIITEAEGPSSLTPMRAGGPGSAMPVASADVVRWLAARSPEDVDKAAVSRASRHGVELRVRYEGRYPSGPNGEILPSYSLAVGCEIGGTPEARAAALADLERMMTPAPKRDIEGWLAELSVIVAKRAEDEFAERMRLQAYTSRLADYPADVARAATLSTSWKFWPAWAELEARCNRLAAPRRNMIAALRRGPASDAERPPVTAEERARAGALLAEFMRGRG